MSKNSQFFSFQSSKINHHIEQVNRKCQYCKYDYYNFPPFIVSKPVSRLKNSTEYLNIANISFQSFSFLSPKSSRQRPGFQCFKHFPSIFLNSKFLNQSKPQKVKSKIRLRFPQRSVKTEMIL